MQHHDKPAKLRAKFEDMSFLPVSAELWKAVFENHDVSV